MCLCVHAHVFSHVALLMRATSYSVMFTASCLQLDHLEGKLWDCDLQRTPKTREMSASVSPGLPDEKGRLQILHIHTARMRGHQLLSADVDIKELAVETKNFSGAELEGLVRAAQSTAMNRHIKVRKLNGQTDKNTWPVWAMPPVLYHICQGE